jgi:hypothetical protein
MNTLLSIDHGAGNIKVYGPSGGSLLPSQASIAAGDQIRRVAGLHTTRPPLRIRTDGHQFYLGADAHDWGRPIENLDDGRFINGSPETVALTYGAFTTYAHQHGLIDLMSDDLHITVGLPQSALTGDGATDTARGVRNWLKAAHHWWADGEPHGLTVADVTVTSQAAGALFDYFLDDTGAFITKRKPEFKGEVAVLSIGMNTLEMLVTERGTIKQRFSDSETLGVRRLLDLCDPRDYYSRGELDSALRAGSLDTRSALPVWAAEITGRLEQRWGRALKRFARVIVVGGGALLLRQEITGRFNGRAWVPEDPIMAVSRGLYKIALMRAG